MNRKDVRIIIIFLAAALTLLVISRWGQSSKNGGSEAKASAYLRIQVGNEQWDLVPLTEHRVITIDQKTGEQNVVEIDTDYIKMLSANCHNQDCVHQGTITADNRDSRLLLNQIICLPNQVLLEWLSAEEAASFREAQ